MGQIPILWGKKSVMVNFKQWVFLVLVFSLTAFLPAVTVLCLCWVFLLQVEGMMFWQCPTLWSLGRENGPELENEMDGDFVSFLSLFRTGVMCNTGKIKTASFKSKWACWRLCLKGESQEPEWVFNVCFSLCYRVRACPQVDFERLKKGKRSLRGVTENYGMNLLMFPWAVQLKKGPGFKWLLVQDLFQVIALQEKWGLLGLPSFLMIFWA